MATLNLGRIKPVFRGAYNNSTAYVVDDIVTSSGSSYICIQASTGNATSNASYWTQMAAGGTDVGTTITTQGDILYRDGSGLQRLAAGTSGQFLKTQGTGANPVWADNVAGLVQTVANNKTDDFSSSTTSSWIDITGVTLTITPNATANKITGIFGISFGTDTSDTVSNFRIVRAIGGGSQAVIPNSISTITSGGGGSFRGMTVGLRSMLDSNGAMYVTLPFYDAPNTTSQIVYQVQQRREQSGIFYLQRSQSDSSTYGRGSVHMNCMEVSV